MAKSESVALLYKILKQSRYPVSLKTLEEKMALSRASIERYLKELRDTHMLTITYDREQRGYKIEHDPDTELELPSHLFTTQEVNALLLIEQIINDLEPGFLKDDTESLKQHLATIRKKFTGNAFNKNKPDGKRIRMINIGKRKGNIKHLTQATQAVLQGKQVSIRYDSRSGEKSHASCRRLSPQRLTHYRDNWYLDAWCHEKNALRTFALDRIIDLHVLKESAKRLSQKALDAYYTQTFGIFGGEIKNIAVLKFTPHRAQWVAEEIWHQKQKGRWLDDGSYQLEIPYGNDLELIGDILKYGDQVEVLAPQELREKIIQQINQLKKIYKK
jgi:predicted DNA-binding transcriptional regulator YafY